MPKGRSKKSGLGSSYRKSAVENNLQRQVLSDYSKVVLKNEPLRPTRFKPLHPSTIRSDSFKRRVRDKKVVITPSTVPRGTSEKRGTLRLTMPRTECIKRKQYKKTMLRKIAAQMYAKGGLGKLKKWRYTRSKAQRSVSFKC